MSRLGIVAIGRNEGERLRRTLSSMVGHGYPVVYVDGNSSDGSPEVARSLGAEVLVEDPSGPTSAANGRNVGFERLCELDPEIRFVQFLDGDCVLVDGWLERALGVFEERPDVALVTGRRREEAPEASPYKKLADLEWDMPVGEVEVTHGDFMVRTEAFRQAGGFDPLVLVSEDCELCIRLRKESHTLLRIGADMSLHDLPVTRFGQWWLRTKRTGYGYADLARLHGKSPERYNVREIRSALFWGVALPVLILGLAWWTRGASFLLLGLYLVMYARIYRYATGRGWSAPDARLFARSCLIAKFPNALGIFTYWIRRLRRRQLRNIEYRRAVTPSPQRELSASISDDKN